MLLLLAPSKTQTKLPINYNDASIPALLQQAEQLVGILREKDFPQIATLMKTSDKLTASTINLINSFSIPFSKDNSHPAIFTFQGDAYSSLTPGLWDESQLAHAQTHLGILSGLYGLLKPLDLMQPYRLEMGLKLETDSGKNMYQFWGTMITEVVNTTLKTAEDKTVINLASTEYSKAIVKKQLVGEMIEIVFKQHKNGVLKTIPIYSKRARGAMANYVVTQKLTRPEQLKNFREEGYSYDEQSSTKNKWIFNCMLD